MKALLLVAAGLLLLAQMDLPYGYYQFLRVAITGTCIVVIYQTRSKGLTLRTVILGLIAVLFNPVFLVTFHQSIWTRIDLAVAGVFVAMAVFPLEICLSSKKLKGIARREGFVILLATATLFVSYLIFWNDLKQAHPKQRKLFTLENLERTLLQVEDQLKSITDVPKRNELETKKQALLKHRTRIIAEYNDLPDPERPPILQGTFLSILLIVLTLFFPVRYTILAIQVFIKKKDSEK